MDTSAKQVTELLRSIQRDRHAENALFRVIERRFHEIAEAKMRRERPDHTLQATALVDEAFWKLIRGRNVDWKSREEFFGTAAKVMRQLLVDYARGKNAEKRGGGDRPIALENVGEPAATRSGDAQQIVEVNEALERLEERLPTAFKVFELHYFMGWELKEIAEDILQISYTSVKRQWQKAQAYLHRELRGED